MTDTGRIFISWEDFNKDALALADMLKKSGPVQGVVGIARGGLVATAIVAHALNIRNVKTVAITSYNGEQQITAELLGSVDSIKDGEGWVFIDDLVDTGQTAKLLHKRYPKAKLAVVCAKPEGQEHADYFVKLFKQESWIVFPWEDDAKK